jgi:hypothetical protein
MGERHDRFDRGRRNQQSRSCIGTRHHPHLLLESIELAQQNVAHGEK